MTGARIVRQGDVAKAAQVSLATVSLALNNHPRVSARMRLHVQSVARRMGFVPNHAARQMARARFGAAAAVDTRQIGFVTCVSDTNALIPMYVAFLQGVEQAVAMRDGVLVFLRGTGEALHRRLVRLNHSGTMDAWIMVGVVNDDSAAPIEAFQRPWVALGDQYCTRAVHEVNLNFRDMGRMAVRHLVELGHRRVGFIGTCMRFKYQREILAGFQEGLQEAGIQAHPSWVVNRQEQDRQYIADTMERCLKASLLPTAWVYGEAGESELVLAWMAQRGRTSGQKRMSMVFCEIPGAMPMVPGISHVEASAVEAGCAAVSLLEEIAGRRDLPPRNLLVSPRLVPGSTAVACAGVSGKG